MAVELHKVAKFRILEIWDYSEQVWGADHADIYVRGLFEAIHEAGSMRHMWRPIANEALSGIYFIRFRHHYIFFRELPDGAIGIISVLHENMNIPSRLKEDTEK